MTQRKLRRRPKMLRRFSGTSYPQSKCRMLFVKCDGVYNDEPVYEAHIWRFK